MRKLKLFLFNFLIMIPYICFGSLGSDNRMLLIWFIVAIFSVCNLFFTDNKKQLILFNMLLLVCALAGIYIAGQIYFHNLVDKGIWNGWNGALSYSLAMFFNVIYIAVITAVELIVKHFYHETFDAIVNQ